MKRYIAVNARVTGFVLFVILLPRQIQVSGIDYTTKTTYFQYLWCVFGGRQPAPYDKRAWQAEHPVVHRMRKPGRCPMQKLADQNDLPVTLCDFFVKNIPLSRTGSFYHHSATEPSS
jgi:hypothetical protein